ncbi:MAG: hypothetical protein ABIU95_07735 [Burkholderiales bacterium]
MKHTITRIMLGLILIQALALAGCAGHAERYAQGLQWQLDNERAKKLLNEQGFPQYTDNN